MLLLLLFGRGRAAPGAKINFGEKSRARPAGVAKLIVAPWVDSCRFKRFYAALRCFTQFLRGSTLLYVVFIVFYVFSLRGFTKTLRGFTRFSRDSYAQ